MMPRLYREAPLNSIWEGSGNVIALDALRTIRKEPSTLEAVLAEIRQAHDPRIEGWLAGIDPNTDESGARRLAETLALCLEASLMVRFSPAAMADAFCAGRPGAFGALPAGTEVDLSNVLPEA